MTTTRDAEPRSLPELHTFEERMDRRRRRDRALATLAVLLIAAVATGILIATHRRTRKGAATPTRQPVPTSSSPSTSAAPSPGSAADLTTIQFQGATVPVSRSSGPFRITGDLASGFAETPLGAALAAVHISARVNPDAGPAVFRPTITAQTTGDPAAFLNNINDQYQADAGQAGVAPGAPVSHGTPGEVMGYKVDSYSVTGPTTVHLLASQPGTSLVVDIPVTVTWTGSDWKLIPPPGGSFSGSRVDSSAGYTTF